MRGFTVLSFLANIAAFLCLVQHNLTSIISRQARSYAFIPDFKIELNLENPRRIISSPGFPDENYPPNTQILYEIQLALDDEVQQLSTRLLLTFIMFSVEDSNFCTKDGLEIADVSGQVRVFCGVQVGKTILSEGPKVYIRFFTNDIVESRGYTILLEMYNTGCSQHFKNVDSGIIESPNYPRRYYADDICVWKIDAPKNKRILVDFEDSFDIRAYEPLCAQDYLAISVTGNFSTHVKRYCHGKKPVSLYSSENSLMFMFHTDCCFEGKGFRAKFTVLDEDEVIPPPPPNPLPQMCTCGIENTGETERIFGGKTVHPSHRYPWVVALVKERNGKNDYFCGGALINRQYILTAAHCLEKEKVSETKIAIGAYDYASDELLVNAAEFILHPRYRKRLYVNDIALVKLEDPVDFNEMICPLCLPTESDLESNVSLAVVTGWGMQNFQNSYVDTALQEVELPIVPHAKCIAKYGGIVLDTNVCAGGESGKDACGGDSGGPLFTKQDNRWHAVGIVSWGLGCGREDYPGVYTRVSQYLKWIKNQTEDAVPCDNVTPPPIQPNLENCGVPNSDSTERIVGGTEARPFEFPWMALIVSDSTVIGAGALISPYYVITAASIFDNTMIWYPELLDIYLGLHRISGSQDNVSKRYTTKGVYLHPKYGVPTPYNNDIAVLKLDAPGGVPDIYKPICLPRSDAWYPPALSLTVAGWGSTSSSGDGSNVLRKVDLNMWSEDKCMERYPRWFTENMICAYKQGADTCHGDNGAPLMRLYADRYYLAGVSSWASKYGCAVENSPRVFSAIHANLQWISELTGLDVM